MPNMISMGMITSKILEVRGKKVMLDSDLASLYGVETYVSAYLARVYEFEVTNCDLKFRR